MCLGHGADVLQEICVEHKVEYSTTDASVLSGTYFNVSPLVASSEIIPGFLLARAVGSKDLLAH